MMPASNLGCGCGARGGDQPGNDDFDGGLRRLHAPGRIGAGFPQIDTGVSGSFNLYGGMVEAQAGLASTTTSGQLVNSAVFFPPSNGSITFDSIFTSFTIDDLAQSATLDYGLLTYALFSPSNGVPEPATRAIMVLGFGGIGAMLRRRRQTLRLA